ncbi:UvrD-helicase domain-containing protein [Corynebacterium sp. 335C]
MKSTFINASAGTGKTYRLAAELAGRLGAGAAGSADGAPAGGAPAAGRLHPSQIIATTFTVKAAAELRQRIRGRLLAEGLDREAQEVSSALIGTVNSISSALVQDHAIDAGLSPVLDVLTEESEKTAFERACGPLLARRAAAHRPLLARMGQDRPADAAEFDRRRSFADDVRGIVALARQNRLSPEHVRAQIAPSIDEALALLDSVAPEDAASPSAAEWARRALDAVDECVEADTAAASKAKPSKAAADRLRAYPALRRTLTNAPETHPWNAWASYGPLPEDEVDDKGKPAKRKGIAGFSNLGVGVAKNFTDRFPAMDEAIAAHPRFRADVRELTELVLGTAADCMDAYALYKRELGLMDFTDQEALALELLDEPAVAATIADTYRILVVDEFQDTNPMQLALFMKLGELAGEIIWVGDPKQSIYGFRGSDPQLMEDVRRGLSTGEGYREEVLDRSWRSHVQPLELTGELFGRSLGADSNAAIAPAEPVAHERRDGTVRVWAPAHPHHSSNRPWIDSMARGVVRLLEDDGIAPGRIAVLARTGSRVEEIAERLRHLGVPSAAARADARETREGRIVLAGLGLLADWHGTQHLVELVTLLDDHAAHAGWFAELSAATAGDDRAAAAEGRRRVFDAWRNDPSLAGLRGLRDVARELTAVEAVLAVIDALDVRRRIAGWTVPRERTDALDALVAMAAAFMDERASAHEPSGLVDLLRALPDAAAPEPPARDAVYVGTMHSSKGLEWDAVVVAVEPYSDRFTPDGHWIRPAAAFDPADPLAGRVLRFRAPVPAQAGAILAAFGDDPEQVRRHDADRENERRLAYVSYTRSVRHTILATTGRNAEKDKKKREAAPNRIELGDIPAVVGSEAAVAVIVDGPDTARLRIEHPGQGPVELPVRYDASSEAILDDEAGSAAAEPPAMPVDDRRGPAPAPGVRPAARFSASAEPSSSGALAFGTVEIAADLGEPLLSGGAEDWNLVGEAVHAFLSLPLREMDDAARLAAADRLTGAWLVRGRIRPEQLTEAADRWLRWLDGAHPGAAVRTEVPFTWVDRLGRRAQGWMDQLVEPADGGAPVLVDHKTYPGDDPVAKVRAEYLGQMAVYADALEAAGAGRPREILVHFPLIGKVVRLAP